VSGHAHYDCMQRWAEAKTIADLGELGALWLEGEIPSQPGYTENCGPDEETEHLIPVLARLNRGGFFTTGSQPGGEGETASNGEWRQRAAVDGFITDDGLLCRIDDALARVDGLTWVVNTASWWRDDYRPAEPVTWADGQDYTWFGARLSRRHLRFPYGETGALPALFGAWQVTVVDLEWGRDDRLWPVLDEALYVGERP